VSVTWNAQVGKVADPAGTAWKPDEIPIMGGVTDWLFICVQGAAKEDCVAE